jgi:hypothetical protein
VQAGRKDEAPSAVGKAVQLLWPPYDLSSELAEVQDKLVAEGERVLLQMLTPVTSGPELEADKRMRTVPARWLR